ncbi:MAG: DNA-directed RNA polymerase [Vulcanococcus sp.]
MQLQVNLLQVQNTPQAQTVHSPESEQLAREIKAGERARQANASSHRRIKELGKESALPYGQELYSRFLDDLAAALEVTFEQFLLDPGKARANAAAIPFFDPFKGVHHIASVALVATIDQLSRKQRLPTFCQNLGKAIEDETRLMRLQAKSPLELRRLMREGVSRRRLASKEVMQELGCPIPAWNDLTRLQVGRFLLDHVLQHLPLVRMVKHRVGRTTPYFILPTAEAEEFIRNCPQRVYSVAHSAMVCPPNDWPGLYGGGLLGNQECIVRVPIQDNEEKDTTAIEHYRQADLSRFIDGINHLQATPLVVDAEMVQLQRTAWENGISGLFPCGRAPLEVPERLADSPTAEELRTRNRLAAMAHRDREQNRVRRVRIERALQMAEELAGRTVWQAYHADHRGRIYTGNKYCTHQGPDTEKALLSFEQQAPATDDGIQWILKAAAGHYGLSRDHWHERLRWGEKAKDAMLAAAEDPLGRLELWRGAKDPWQFLQLCRGLKQALETGASGVPIRFDQTTSGCGLLSTLVRDAKTARLCNVFGTTPRDLYSVIAERVVQRLTVDLELGDEKERALAELWLSRGIDRGLVKGPVLATPYGGSYMSLCDSLVDALDRHLGYVPLSEYAYRVAVPSKYLASHLWAELKEQVAPCLEVKKWLKVVCRKVMKAGYPLEWTTPMGWPMRLADREPTRRQVQTLLFGKKVNITMQDQPIDSPLSATQANKGIGANFTHGFDAALCQAVISRAVGLGMPLLTNHDCFATHMGDATVLHTSLLHSYSGMFRTNWLAVFREEVQLTTGISLPDPPYVGTLQVGLIGTNPYLYS